MSSYSLQTLILIIYSFIWLNAAAEDVNLDLYVLVDPTLTNWLKDTYGIPNYYQEILDWINDALDQVSPQFEHLDVHSSILPGVKINLAYLEIMESWNQNSVYKSLEPAPGVAGQTYTGSFGAWLMDNNKNTYDDHLMLSQLAAPLGASRCICQAGIRHEGYDGCYASVNVVNLDSDPLAIWNFGHELGHNFGGEHDAMQVHGTEQCTIANGDTGIMSKESPNPGGINYALNGWSTCSISQFETYYNDHGGLKCLAKTPGKYATNYVEHNGGGSGGSSYTALDGTVTVLDSYHRYGEAYEGTGIIFQSGTSFNIKCNAPKYIEIMEASYGKNCNSQNRNNHLTQLKSVCDGLTNCNYSPNFISITTDNDKWKPAGCRGDESAQYDYRYMCVEINPSLAPLIPRIEPNGRYSPYNPDVNVFVVPATTAYLFGSLLFVVLVLNISCLFAGLVRLNKKQKYQSVKYNSSTEDESL
eukprot:121660_1